MASNRGGRARKPLIFTIIALLLLLGAYGLGRRHGGEVARRQPEPAGVSPGLREIVARAARGEQIEAELAAIEGRVQALEAQVRLLQARRRLHLALLSLDEQNFGLARDHLNAAGKELAAVQPPPAGSDPGVLSRLAEELSSAQLAAGEEISAQRQQILDWVRRLDTQIPIGIGREGPVVGQPGSDEPEGTAAPNPERAPAPDPAHPSTGEEGGRGSSTPSDPTRGKPEGGP